MLYTTVRYDRCVALAVGRLAVRSPRLTRGQAEAAPGGRSGSLGSAPPPRPSLLAASARRRRRASQMFASALTGRMHKQHISDPSSCYIRTVARAWTCCVHEPPEAAWPPPPTAPAVRSTATLRRLALLLAVAAKLASHVPAAGDTAIAAAAAAAAELLTVDAATPAWLFGTRENRTSYSQKPPRSAPSVGRRADANRKRAAGRQVWRAEGRLSSGSIFRRLGLMERAGKPDECLGSTLIPQVLQSCLMLRELSSAGSGRSLV